MPTRKFAISDIHGCAGSFRALLEKTGLSREDELFLLGDYVDRGPGTKELIDTILDLQDQGYRLTCLRGNHEQMLLDAITDRPAFNMWLYNGGKETLLSYGLDHPASIPPRHLDFFQELRYYHEVDDYLLVHAGINFRHPEPLSDHFGLIWIRDWYSDIDLEWLAGRKIVHGHTPMRQKDIAAQLKLFDILRALDIDAGCAHKFRGLGDLCAFELGAEKLYFQENVD